MSKKMWVNKRYFMIILINYIQEHEATKKQTVRLQVNENMSKEYRTRLMSCYWKRKGGSDNM